MSDYAKLKIKYDKQAKELGEFRSEKKRQIGLILRPHDRAREEVDKCLADIEDQQFNSEAGYLNNFVPWITLKKAWQSVRYMAGEKSRVKIEQENAIMRTALQEINNLCGTISMSSHNQMRDAIEGAVELSDAALGATT